MCTGAEIALIAGAAVGAVGAISQGQTANKQSKLQAAILGQQATSERRQAEANEVDFRTSQSRLAAARRAALGASGVDPSTGSPLSVSEDIAGETELQALRIRSGGDIRATRLDQQALLERFSGKAAQSAGLLRGGSLLVSGTGKAFS